MKSTRTLITTGVVALWMTGASPEAAPPQRSGAAETSRQGPTAAELSEVRSVLAEYRKLWNEFDAETRGIARQYGAPTPDDLERMFRDWESGREASMPTLPGNLPGNLAETFRKLPGNASARPAKPGEEAPDFAKGASPEALETLKDAKVDLDDIRDKHAETASCSPEARSAKQALETKLQSYRKALADMEAARADVEREKGAGADLERYSLVGGALGAVKSTADAAMELFGAAATLMPDTAALKPLKTGMEAVGAAYNVAGGLVSTATAKNGMSAAAGVLTTATGVGKLSVNDQAAVKIAQAGLEGVSKGFDTAVLNSDTSREGATSRGVETTGNVIQMSGTLKGALAELPGAGGALKTTGAVFSAAGTVTSTSAKYDRELGNAFDQIIAGRDERVNLDNFNTSTLRQIDAKRVEFMEKIAALEAEIGHSSCVK